MIVLLMKSFKFALTMKNNINIAAAIISIIVILNKA